MTATAGSLVGLLVGRVSSTLCRIYGPNCSGGNAAGPGRFRTPAVTGITLILFAAAYARYGFARQYFVSVVFASVMVAVAAVDIETYRIPNCLVTCGTVALASLTAAGFLPLRPSVAGALAGGLVMLIAAAASRGGMGAGDVKVSFVIGGFVGWPAITLALFTGFGMAAVAGLILMALRLKGRRDVIPFGPFLAAGGIIAELFASPVLSWYLSRVVSA
ncbi:MAG: prepilin peptidase [Ignavibacteriales bacterium]